jgi:hypothetical protein
MDLIWVPPSEIIRPYQTMIRGQLLSGHLVTVNLHFKSKREGLIRTAPTFIPSIPQRNLPNLLGMSHLCQLTQFTLLPAAHQLHLLG